MHFPMEKQEKICPKGSRTKEKEEERQYFVNNNKKNLGEKRSKFISE